MSTQTKTVPPQSTPSAGSLFASLFTWLVIILLAVSAIVALKPPKSVAATADAGDFSAERAMTHVRAIARVPHPIGSAANETVKEYLMAQLSGLGLNPQVFPATGIRQRAGNIAVGDTHDIVGRLPGTGGSHAMMLMAHYDSVYRAPGAADDGASVAAILETVRALRSGPALKNDLIVLFTDGEESGLLGAEAFAASHPWMKDVELALNFEARGDNGASLLFETSANNRLLVEGVAKATPHPTGSSLFYALYKLLPNDTDFTVFRPYGTPGLNFAFGENLQAYHSRLDTADNLNASSLQHHGSYALGLTRHFGQADLAQLKSHTGDAIFFDWFGGDLMVYGQSWAIPGEIVLTILLVLAIALSVRKAEVTLSRVLLALLPAVVVLVLVPVVLSAAGWLVLRLVAGHMTLGDSPANAWLLIGLVLLGACAGGQAFSGFRKRFTVQELAFAGLAIGCLLSWVIALVLPAASYLLFWPLFLMMLGLLAIEVLNQGAQMRAQWVAGLAGTAVAILLFAPIAYLLFVFLTLQLLTLAAVGLLLGLFFLICVPLLNIAIPPNKWRPALVLLIVGAIASIVMGVKQSHNSIERPRSDNISYGLDADNHTAAWLSFDRSPDTWTSQFIPDAHQQPKPMPDYLAGLQRPVLSSPAPVHDVAPPVADVTANETVNDLHKVRMNVRSQRNATRIFMAFDKDVQPTAIKIAGREVVPSQKAQGLKISFFGAFPKGVDLELTFKSQSGVGFWIMDQSYGLPESGVSARPQNLMASEGSDLTIVCRKYKL